MPVTPPAPESSGFDLGGIGSIASGIGSIVGTFSNLFGGNNSQKKALKFAKQQQKYNEWLNRNRIWLTVQDAKQAGIHPLAALGASGIGGFAQAVPQYDGGSSWDAGSAIGAGLQGLGNSLSDYSNSRSDREERKAAMENANRQAGLDRLANKMVLPRSRLDELNERLVAAQILESTSRTKLNLAESEAQGATRGGVIQGPGSPVDPLRLPFTGGEMKRGKGSDANAFENRYSDVMSNIFGILNYIDDYWQTLPKFGGKVGTGKMPPGTYRGRFQIPQ